MMLVAMVVAVAMVVEGGGKVFVGLCWSFAMLAAMVVVEVDRGGGGSSIWG